jgi:hypothetical protein
MLTEIEQQNLDIDWFFMCDDKIGFVASGGGKLPYSIANLGEKSQLLISYFRGLPIKNGIIINSELGKVLNHDVNDEYLNDFKYMGERGLYTFDKTILNNFLERNYHLVTKPINPLKINELPSEIQKILMQTKYNGDLDSELSICTTNIG